MAGNEKKILSFFLKEKNQGRSLKYLGKIHSIKIPYKKELIELNANNIEKFHSDDSRKKADVLINEKGCSLKQKGKSFLFNRLYKRDIEVFFNKFFNPKKSKNIINKIDNKIKECHSGKIKQNFNFLDVMTEIEFKKILYYLMTEGSPNFGKSNAAAEFIIEGEKNIKTSQDISIFKFDEYFEKKKDKITFRIYRQFYGNKSKTEHRRAKKILSDDRNKAWCFDNIVGSPKAWRTEINEKDRKTVYMLSLEKL